MHELSIALRIVEALDEELKADQRVNNSGEPDGMDVSTVSIQVGALTGLVPEALEFSWQFATQNSILSGSNLDIQVVNAAGYCQNCQSEVKIGNLSSMRCPDCRSPISQITGGNELEILTVELQSTQHEPSKQS